MNYSVTKVLYLFFYFFTIIQAITSGDLFCIFVAFELNTLIVISIIMNSGKFSEEVIMTYFLVQLMTGVLFLFMPHILSMFSLSFNMSNSFLVIFMMKMGVPPFHFWTLNLADKLSWEIFFLISVVQKVPPLIILSSLKDMSSNLIYLASALSIIVGSIGGWQQQSIQKVLLYSSMNHMGWMMLAIPMSNKMILVYFIMYSLTSLNLFFMLKMLNIFNMSQVVSKTSPYLITFFAPMAILSSMPPLWSFLIKAMMVMMVTMNKMWGMSVVMVLTSALSLCYYMQFLTKSMLMSWNSMKTGGSPKNSSFPMMLVTTSNLFMICLSWMILAH